MSAEPADRILGSDGEPLEVEHAEAEPKDVPRLPDEWGYDYEQHRFMSPYMKRSLGVALLPFAISALVVAAIAHGGLLGSLLALVLVLYATVGVCCVIGWCIRRVCARLYYYWWPW